MEEKNAVYEDIAWHREFSQYRCTQTGMLSERVVKTGLSK